MNVTMLDPGNFTPHYVDALSRALATQGVNVDIITSPALFEKAEDTSLYRTDNLFFRFADGRARPFLRRHARLRRLLKAAAYPAGLFRTWRTLRNRAPGVLHVQWALFPLLDCLLLRKLRSRGWWVVYTAHEALAETAGAWSRWHFERIYSHVDAVVVHTSVLREKLLRERGDVVRTICEIPEGISTFPRSEELERGRARELVGISPEAPIFLFFGMIKPYKGLECLLRAWRRVINRYPQARLVIAGELMTPAAALEHLIDELAIAESLVLRLQYIPTSEAQYFFCAADAVVLPYLRISTSGIVPLAYRFARPVIATSAGSLPDLVQDGRTGFLVPPGSEEALAEALCRAIDEPDTVGAMGAYAYQWFEKERSWAEIARRTAALYESVTGAVTEPAASRASAG